MLRCNLGPSQQCSKLGGGQFGGSVWCRCGREQGPRFTAQQATPLVGERVEDRRVVLTQHRSQLVVGSRAVPYGVLLCPGQHRDCLCQWGIRRQGSVRGQVGAQNVRQHQGVAGVGLLARDRIPVPVARYSHRVDREHLPPCCPQASDEQAAVGLDRHGDALIFGIAGVGEQLHQGGESGGVVADPTLGDQGALAIDERHVVVLLGPVDATENGHYLLHSLGCR